MPTYRQQDVETPHFSLPFQFSGLNGAARVNEQDTSEDIIDCIKVILAHPIGSREELPEFGVPDILFREITKGLVADVRAAIERWEPRVDLIVSERGTMDHMVRQLIVQARGSDPQ